MKSCLGLLIVLFVVVAVLGTGGLIWYLSSTAEFSRKDGSPAATNPPAVKPAPHPR
jgi:flagellar basal body-associated protein FliL